MARVTHTDHDCAGAEYCDAGEVSDDLLRRVISVLRAGLRASGVPASDAGFRRVYELIEELERVQAAR